MSDGKLLEKIKNVFHKFRKLENDELNKVSGAGNDPEEFEWHGKDYVTPEKEQNPNKGWVFHPVGDKDNKDIFNK